MRLYEIDKTEPSKIYLGPVELYYKPAHDRMIEVKNNENRITPRLHSSAAVIYWWDKMMHFAYGVGYGVIPRHLYYCLSNHAVNKHKLESKLKAYEHTRPEHEFIFVSKGTYRENYALKILEALALPKGARMLLELENKYVEPNLLEHVKVFPDAYEHQDVLIVSTHHQTGGRGTFHTTLLRWAKLLEIKATPSAVNLKVKLSDYPNNIWGPKNDKAIPLGENTYDLLASYAGQRNLPIDGYFCQLMALPRITSASNCNDSENESKAFLDAINCLNQVKESKLNRNIYYRVSRISRCFGGQAEGINIIDGQLNFHPGDEIEIELETFTKNLGTPGYPSEEEAELNVLTTEEEDRIKIVSQSKVRLSKFGQPTVRLRVQSLYEEIHGEIIFQPAHKVPRITELRLPFKTIVPEI